MVRIFYPDRTGETAWRPGLAPPSTSSTAGWSATPEMAGRANRLATGLSITNSLPGISTSTIRKRNWAALNRRSSVQVSGRTGQSGQAAGQVMKIFCIAGGAGALPIYWDKDWAYPFSCKLVNYQTAHSALVDGEYIDCVEENFNIRIRN